MKSAANPRKRNHKIERARDRIAINDDARAENQHQESENPEEKWRHGWLPE